MSLENSLSFQSNTQSKISGNVSTIAINAKTKIPATVKVKTIDSEEQKSDTVTISSSTKIVLPQDASAIDSIDILKNNIEKYIITIIILFIIILCLIFYIAHIKKDQNKI